MFTTPRSRSLKMAAVSVRVNPIGGTILLLLVGFSIFYWFGGANLFKSEPRISMRELLCVSIDLAKRGGIRVKEIHEGKNLEAKTKGLTKEGAKEMLTDGDLQSHRAILYGFDKAFPGIQVISEEHERKPVDFKNIPDPVKHMEEVEKIVTSDQSIPLNEITVWIDPLDATQEYTESLTQYVTVMVCVAVRGTPMIGVIHQPFDKKTAWGWVGYGHSSDLTAEKTAPAGDKEKPATQHKKIIVSRSHAGDVKDVTKESFGEDVEVIPAGGAGYKTLKVIKGEADAYVHVTLIKKWDICAGNALLHSVGGHMTTLDGDYIDYSKGDPKNKLGLLATLTGHNSYRDKLTKFSDKLKREAQES